MHFTETWLEDLTLDSPVRLDGFHLIRADKTITQSGKRNGGRIAPLVKDKWCNPGHILVRQQ